MKYSKISVKNFKGIEEKVYIPKHSVCVLTGLNGAGKTSFMEAVRFTMTGKAPKKCIRAGHEISEIETELKGQNIRYEKGNKGTVICMNEKKITAKELFEFLYGDSMVDNKIAENITYGELLEHLEPADFANLLLRYVPDELTYDIIKSYLPNKYIDSTPATRERVEFTQQEMEKATIVLKKVIPESLDKFGIREITQMHELFAEQKLECKRELEVLYKDYKALPSTTTKCDRAIEEIEEELKQVYEKTGAQAEKRKAIESYNKAVQAREKQLKQIAEIEAQVQELKVKEAPSEKEYEKNVAKFEKNSKIKEELTLSVGMLKESIQNTQQTIDKLSQPICVLSEKLKCSTDKSQLSEELKDSIRKMTDSISLQEKQILSLQEEEELLLKKQAEYSEKKEMWDKKQLLEKHLQMLKENLMELPEKVEEKIEDIETKKKELETLLVAVKASAKKADLEKQLKEATENYHLYNYLAIALSKKGIVYEKILAFYLTYFENICNETTKQIGKNFKIKFYFKDGVNISCKADRNNYYIPYENLSSGEKMFASIVILDMLTQLTCAVYEDQNGNVIKSGVNVLFLDGIEKMDENTIKQTLSFLTSSEISNYYDHIFINMVNHQNLESLLKNNKIDWIQM